MSMESSLGLTSLRKVIDVDYSFDDLPSISNKNDEMSPSLGPIVKKPTYLQALLGDHPPKLGGFEHASLISNNFHPSSVTNEEVSTSQFKIPSSVLSPASGSVASR